MKYKVVLKYSEEGYSVSVPGLPGCIKSRGFGFEVEVTAKVAKLARLGFAIYEVPISYYGRTYAEGKKIGMWDGLHALWYILRFNLLCSLRSSYTQIPDRNHKPIR